MPLWRRHGAGGRGHPRPATTADVKGWPSGWSAVASPAPDPLLYARWSFQDRSLFDALTCWCASPIDIAPAPGNLGVIGRDALPLRTTPVLDRHGTALHPMPTAR